MSSIRQIAFTAAFGCGPTASLWRKQYMVTSGEPQEAALTASASE
jgi:hypothetical protein